MCHSRPMNRDRIMEHFQNVLLGVWQEACRHIDISQATANIASMLVNYVPVEQVFVRRIDKARSCLETVAVGLVEHGQQLPEPRTDCAPAEFEALLAWCGRGKVAHRGSPDATTARVASMIFGRFDGDVLVGPLGDSDGHCGILVFLASAGQTFRSDARRIGPTLARAVFRRPRQRPARAGNGRAA